MGSVDESERLISRYLNGEISQEEEIQLWDWINEDADNKQSFFEIKDTWDASLKTGIQESEQLLLFYKKQAAKKKKYQLPGWISGVAVAAVLFIGLLIGNFLPHNQIDKSQVESFIVPMGSRSQVTLSDGTMVKLNSGSELMLCENFSSTRRVVTLKGEGYFEVKSDKWNPFIVKTDNFDVKVTGTKFNISSYADDQVISATLAEGKIKLRTKGNKSIRLNPGEKISFNQETMSDPVLEQADVRSELAWTEGNFIFEGIPFTDLMKRLERWYDVKLVHQADEFSSILYSGQFKNQETIWQVLDALKLTSPLDYKKVNFREFEIIYKPM